MTKKKHSLIVLSGVDGSGKTTIANALKEAWRSQGKELQYIHGHGYQVSEQSFRVSDAQVRRWRYFFRLLIPGAWLDQLFTYHRKYRPILKEKDVICDRYFYDKVVRMMYYGICGPRLARLYVTLLPRPDKIFFLHAPLSCILARKQEYTLVELQVFEEKYRYVAGLLKAPVIDTSRPMEECLQSIMKED